MDATPDRAASTTLPVACTLGPDDGPDRLRRWQRLHDLADPVAELRGGHLEVRYQPELDVAQELAVLAAAEQDCCSFVTWSVAATEGGSVLRVTAPADAPEVLAPIAAMFGASLDTSSAHR